MKRIVLTLLAALAVVAAIGPASALARGKVIVPTPGAYVSKPSTRTKFKVSFELTAKDKIVDFTDGSDVTAVKPKPVFTVRRDDPKQFPDNPMAGSRNAISSASGASGQARPRSSERSTRPSFQATPWTSKSN